MIITSAQNGNWTDTSTWDSGTIPTINDDVVIAHQVVADTSFIEVNSITTNLSPATSRNLELVQDITFVSTLPVQPGNGNGTPSIGLFWIRSNINYTLIAPAFISAANGAANIVVRSTAVATGNIVGDLFGSDTSASSPCININNISGQALNVTGNVYAGASNGVQAGASVDINIVGDVFGSGVSGINNSREVNLIGNAHASSTSRALQANELTINGFMYNNNGNIACDVNNKLYIDTPVMEYLTQRSDNSDFWLYSAGVSLGNPDPTDVREGVEYGPNDELEGEIVIPDESSVTLGVPYDITKVGTANNTAESFLQAIQDNTTIPVAERLRNVATVQTTGDQFNGFE